MTGEAWIAEGQRLACLLVLAAPNEDGVAEMVRKEAFGDPVSLARKWAAASGYLATLLGRYLLGPEGSLSEHCGFMTETVLSELERCNEELGLPRSSGLIPDHPQVPDCPDFES